jgi:hypothetical protein
MEGFERFRETKAMLVYLTLQMVEYSLVNGGIVKSILARANVVQKLPKFCASPLIIFLVQQING